MRTMGAQTAPPAEAFRHLLLGYRVTQALYAAFEAGLADLLAGGASERGRPAASRRGARPAPRACCGLLASEGVFAQTEDGRFALTPLAEPLGATRRPRCGRWRCSSAGRPLGVLGAAPAQRADAPRRSTTCTASTSSRTTAGTRRRGRSSTRPWRRTPPRRCGRWRPRTTSRRWGPWWTWAAGPARWRSGSWGRTRACAPSCSTSRPWRPPPGRRSGRGAEAAAARRSAGTSSRPCPPATPTC